MRKILFSFSLITSHFRLIAIASITWLCISLLTYPVYAQLDLPPSPTGKFTRAGLVGQIISGIIPVVLGIAGFITVIMIVISGIQFITSSGNPEAAGAARSRLIFAIIGFVVIILSFAILQVINSVFLGTTIV